MSLLRCSSLGRWQQSSRSKHASNTFKCLIELEIEMKLSQKCMRNRVHFHFDTIFFPFLGSKITPSFTVFSSCIFGMLGMLAFDRLMEAKHENRAARLFCKTENPLTVWRETLQQSIAFFSQCCITLYFQH